MKGYKVFNSNWTCYNNFQYEVGKTYEMDDEPIICRQGFHFCTDPKDCFRYYNFWDDVKIAEIEALGDIDREYINSKCCTNKIKIIRELSLENAKIETETTGENVVLLFLDSCSLPLACPVKVIKSITFSEEE